MPTKATLSILLVASLALSVAAQNEKRDRKEQMRAMEWQLPQKPQADRETKQFKIEVKRSSSKKASKDKKPENPEPVDPLVPGFGNPAAPGPSVPEFGVALEATPQSVLSRDDKLSRIVQFMISRHDKNGDDVLDKEEWAGALDQLAPADTNRDGRLTPEEIAKWMAERMAVRHTLQSEPKDKDKVSTNSESPPDNGSRSYPSPAPREGLKKSADGLPSWFLEKDANRDGQVAMAEYSTDWTDAIAEEFMSYDLNNDGMVTAQECTKGPSPQQGAMTVASSNPAQPLKANKVARDSLSHDTRKTRPDKRALSASSPTTKSKGASDEKLKRYLGEMKRKKVAGKKAAGKS